MNLRTDDIIVKKYVIENDKKYKGETVLTYKIEYPQFYSQYYQSSLNLMNKYYYMRAFELQKYFEKELYKQAVEQYDFAKQNDYPVMKYEGFSTYEVTYNDLCIISLFYDHYVYSGGAHGNTIRTSDTWNLQNNKKVKLDDIFECSMEPERYILKYVAEEIKKDPDIYFSEDKSLISQSYNPDNFYCLPGGIVFYYQQYDIAPYSSGIREFFIPYDKCVRNPVNQCLFP